MWFLFVKNIDFYVFEVYKKIPKKLPKNWYRQIIPFIVTIRHAENLTC